MPPLVPDELLPPPLDTPKKRVAFTLLLEFDLVHPGMTLRLGKTERLACVLEDGTLVCDGVRASIHKLAALCLGKPSANGWEHWQYLDKKTGEYRPLDALRQEMRDIIEKPVASAAE